MTTSHASCWNSSFRRANCLWAHDSASASPSHYPGQGSCNCSCSFLATLLYVDHLIIQGRAHATAIAASLQFCSMLTVSLSKAGVMQPQLQLLCNPAPCLLFSEITASAPVLQLCGSGPHSCSRAHSRRRQTTPEHREGGGSTGNLPQTSHSILFGQMAQPQLYVLIPASDIIQLSLQQEGVLPLANGWEQLFGDPPARHHRHSPHKWPRYIPFHSVKAM